MLGMPLISKAQVFAHDPNGQALYVMLTSSIQVPIKIQYGHAGPADALRISQKPMPGIGTWGVVSFPAGDIRNGIWIRSYYPSQIDAIHTTGGNATDPTDPFIDYDAHFSGHWRLLDGYGNLAEQWPDGSYFVLGSGNALPTTYRHIVSSGQQQLGVPFTFAQRVPNPPAPLQWLYQQATSGAVGGTSFGLDRSGNVTVSGGPIATLTVKFGGATLTINASGQAELDLPGTETLNITQGGGSPTDFLALVSKLVTAFNSHVHTGVQSGGSNTGTPSSSWSSSTIDSTAIKISN